MAFLGSIKRGGVSLKKVLLSDGGKTLLQDEASADEQGGMIPRKESRLGDDASSAELRPGGVDEGALSYDPDVAFQRLGPTQVFAAPAFWDGRSASSTSPAAATTVRVVCISDTHGRHKHAEVPPGDVLVHGGDFTDTGAPSQVASFAQWLLRKKAEGGFSHVVVIAGNHDTTFDEPYYERRGGGRERFHRQGADISSAATKDLLRSEPGIT